MRTRGACAEARDVIEATAGGQKAFGRLNASVTDVDRLFAAQQRALDDRRAATEAVRAGRRVLRDLLKGVVKVSALVELDESTARVMQLPLVRSDELLLADARAILDKTTPHADVFVAEGLPPNVLTDLPKQIAALTAAKLAQSQTRQQYPAATKAIMRALDAGDDAIGVLESILVNSPNADPGAVAKLRQAKRVGPRAKEDVSPEAPASDTTKAA